MCDTAIRRIRKGRGPETGVWGLDFVIKEMKCCAKSKGIDDSTTKRLWWISCYGGSADV